MMPLNQASMAAVTREESGDAAGIYNMARNLGGSVGLAVVGTFIDRRNSLHIDGWAGRSTRIRRWSRNALARCAASHFALGGDLAYAQLQATKELVLTVHRQASVVTFSGAFYVLRPLCCSACCSRCRLGRQGSPAGHRRPTAPVEILVTHFPHVSLLPRVRWPSPLRVGLTTVTTL